MKTLFASMAAAALLLGAQAARADDGPYPHLRCVISQCDGGAACQAPFKVNDTAFSVAAGSDFMFTLTDDWSITPGRYSLEGRHYVGASYLSKTVLNIAITRPAGDLTLTLGVVGTDVEPRNVTAHGHCQEVKTQPIAF